MSPTYEIPSELIYNILINVFADSIHSICTSSDVSWQLDFMATICTTSYKFNAIAMDIATKAFGLLPNDEESMPLAIQRKLRNLYHLGVDSRTMKPTRTVNVSPADEAPLIKAYTLYMLSQSLRLKISSSHGSVFVAAHEYAHTSIVNARPLCGSARPQGIQSLLSRALDVDLQLVQTGLSVVRTRIGLEDTIEELTRAESARERGTMQSGAEPPSLVFHSLRERIHAGIQKLEIVQSSDCEQISIFKDESYRSYQLPQIVKALHRCASLYLQLDEFDIRARASCLADNWRRALPQF